MKQFQSQYNLGEVFIRPHNYPEQMTYDFGHFIGYKEFCDCLMEEFGWKPEECYVSSSSLGFYEEGCSLDDAFKRYEILEAIESENPDLIFEYDAYVRNLCFMSNEELSEIKKWFIIYETLDEFIQNEIEENIEFLSENVIRNRVEEKVRNNEIIVLDRGWLLVKML